MVESCPRYLLNSALSWWSSRFVCQCRNWRCVRRGPRGVNTTIPKIWIIRSIWFRNIVTSEPMYHGLQGQKYMNDKSLNIRICKSSTCYRNMTRSTLTLRMRYTSILQIQVHEVFLIYEGQNTTLQKLDININLLLAARLVLSKSMI